MREIQLKISPSYVFFLFLFFVFWTEDMFYLPVIIHISVRYKHKKLIIHISSLKMKCHRISESMTRNNYHQRKQSKNLNSYTSFT